jgi:hypothetical protein
MITKDGNSDRKLEAIVGKDQKDELMHVNTSNSVDDSLSNFGPEAGLPPESIEEKIVGWAHDVAGSDEKAEEILGQDDRKVKNPAARAEHIMDIPEGQGTLVDAGDDGNATADMQVVEFQED